MSGTWRLDRQQTALVLIDVQEKLLPHIDGHERLAANLAILVRGCHALGLPIVVTEQYVKGLGPTVAPLRQAFDECGVDPPIEKSCFSAGGCESFRQTLNGLGRGRVLLAGIETHVCVYQTAMDLLETGFDVTIVADAVSSRTARNREVALQRMTSAGVTIGSVEMCLFELCTVSGTDEFRTISKLVR